MIMNTTDYIFEAFNNQPIRVVSGKKYCVNTITDHAPATRPELLQQIIAEATQLIEYTDADLLVGEEDRGGYICSLLSIPWMKPFTLTVWNPSGFEGEIAVDFKNAYTDGTLYLNGIDAAHKKVIIVEDIIDTGGTIIAMVQLLQKAGVEVIDIFAIAEKVDYGGKERIYQETGILAKTLVSFTSGDSVSTVVSRNNQTI
jgi:adenine/guanine phosphoribosyltransferase-like PRPP-binding protein